MRRGWTTGLVALVAACAGGSQPATQAAPAEVRLPGIVSTDTLAAWLQAGPVLLLDVRTDVFAYLSGHLPGAEYLNTETIRASRGGIPTQLLEPEAYARLFSRLGIRIDQRVVIYSAGETHNIDATFLAWLLAGFGHRAVYVLDGGYFKWQLEQRAIARKYPRIPESRFPTGPFHPEAASLAEVQAALRGGNALLVDARPPDQFAGQAGAQMRRGHIPGAINHYWQSDLTREGFGYVWKDRDQLRRDYGAQGITPDREIIAYCNSATEASHVHFTLRYLLGFPRVRVYVGSWTEWAEREELPVTTGP
jgi:thiosulfate/3-mercaptopyruvate sulfurtransferase